MKKLIAILMIVGCVLAVWLYDQQQPSAPPPSYRVALADINSSVSAVGDISATTLVDVGAQVTGQIKSFHVDIGDEVEAGQLLAVIDSSSQEARVAEANSHLISAQAQLQVATSGFKVAKSNVLRERELKQVSATSARDLELAEAEFANAQAILRERSAAIEAANISLKIAKTDLALTRIVAPIAGTVVSTAVRAGQSINAAQSSPTLLQIADVDTMLLRMQISEADVGKIKVGQRIKFSTLAGDKTYESKISSLDPGLTLMSRGDYSQRLDLSNTAIYYYARASIQNSDGSLHIGMTTQNEIMTASAEQVLAVPNEYLISQNNQDFVSLSANNEAGFSLQKVELGISDGIMTEVKSGLKLGDKINLPALDNPMAPQKHNRINLGRR